MAKNYRIITTVQSGTLLIQTQALIVYIGALTPAFLLP
jgi:hypothetical protein